MRRSVGTALVAVGATLALTSCGTSTAPGRLMARLNDLTDATNARNAPALRTAVGRFLLEVDQQGNAGNLTVAKVAQLKVTADMVLTDADLIDQAKIDAGASASAAAAASASAAAAASPSPTPSPSASPSPSQKPSPSARPSAAPSRSPSRSPSPILGGLSPGPTTSPAG